MLCIEQMKYNFVDTIANSFDMTFHTNYLETLTSCN